MNPRSQVKRIYSCPGATITVAGSEVQMPYYDEVRLCEDCAARMLNRPGEPEHGAVILETKLEAAK